MALRARRLVFLASLAFSPQAAAAPRLTVGPVEGDRVAAIPAQLAGALCVRFDCVLWPKVSSHGRVDASRVRQAGVAGVLTGRVARRAKVDFVDLTLSSGPGTVMRGWSFPRTEAGLVAAGDLHRLEKELEVLLAPPAAPLPKAQRPTPTSTPPPTSTTTSTPPPTSTPTSPPTPTPAPTPSSLPVPRRWIAAAEVGPFWSKRSLGYGGTAAMTGTLRTFEADSIGGLHLRLELFPLARRAGSALGGLGLTVGYATAFGLETSAPTGEVRPTAFGWSHAGLAWRAPPLTSLRLVLVPSLAYQWYWVEVSPPIDGLPDATLAGPRLGLGAELPVGGRATLLLGVGWVAWRTAQDLVAGSPAFFPGSGAAALEGMAGLGVALGGPFSARLVVEYSRTSYALDPDPSGQYAASSATDETLVIRATLRAEL